MCKGSSEKRDSCERLTAIITEIFINKKNNKLPKFIDKDYMCRDPLLFYWVIPLQLGYMVPV